MTRRQPLPRLWLMTDERQGDGLWRALGRLPRGAGIVFRHYGLPHGERRRLFERVRRIARMRRLTLVVAGSPLPGADGTHGLRELKAAERAGVDLVFLSPVYPTRSHPGAPALGPRRFALMAHQAKVPVIALGGMDKERARTLGGADGWAGIDAWS